MNKQKSKILVLVEGGKTDYKLMKKLLEIYGISESHEVVSYNTNIYTLYNEMFLDGDPYSMDILQNLKEHEREEAKKNIFDQKYSDILLIFDLDPQDPQFSENKITEMVNFFIESSDMGKLYLNYPMVESFYHMSSIPDKDYNSYCVTLDELRNGTYKSRVNRENRNHDYTKFAVDKAECDIVISQNLHKSHLITGRKESINPFPKSIDILIAQLSKLKEEQIIHVLCTCIFYITDYNPTLINYIKNFDS